MMWVETMRRFWAVGLCLAIMMPGVAMAGLIASG